MRTPRTITTVLVAGALTLALAPAPCGAAPDRAPARASGHHRPTGRVVVRFDESASPAQRARALRAAGIDTERVRQRGHGLAVSTPAAGDSPARAAARLARQPGVRTAAAEGVVRALEALVPPDDPQYAGATGQVMYLGPSAVHPWSVNLEPAWDRAFNAPDHTLVAERPGVRIAIIDTGVSLPYSESTGEFVPVWDYVGAGILLDSGVWYPAKTPDADPGDVMGHGTQVASILRAKTANAKGIAGVLHSAEDQVLVYRVLDANGFGDTADFVDAIYDAADNGARIINCSLGESIYDADGFEIPGLYQLYADAVAYAWARGCVVVAASGNLDPLAALPYGHYTYAPACVDDPVSGVSAVAVAAIDPSTGATATFSNYGPDTQVDFAAPGVGVWNVPMSGVAAAGQGTSYATPIVSGSLALLLSTAPKASPAIALAALEKSGRSYPLKAVDTGYGLPDVDAAYATMRTALAEQPAVWFSAGPPAGRLVTLSWDAAPGTDVVYRYGEVGGPEYSTTARTAPLVLSAEGPRTVWLRTYATDRWSHQATLTAGAVVPADGLGPLAAERIAGRDRYRTAVAVSRRSFPSGAPAVVIASGRTWPDALSAAPLAAAVGGPLLLTDPSSLTIATRDEIARLAPARIFVVGGTGAVSATARSQLDGIRTGDTLVTLAGADRYQTSALVASRLSSEQGGVPGRRAFVCSGATYPDALSGAAVAGAAGQPVLLTSPTSLSAPAASTIAGLGITNTVIVGGTAAVSASVLSALPSPDRWAGADRYATSREVARRAVAEGTLAYTQIGFAKGDAFPDALSAGPRMASLGGPVLLLPATADAALTSWLRVRGPLVSGVTVFGGAGALPYGLENAVRLSLRGQ